MGLWFSSEFPWLLINWRIGLSNLCHPNQRSYPVISFTSSFKGIRRPRVRPGTAGTAPHVLPAPDTFSNSSWEPRQELAVTVHSRDTEVMNPLLYSWLHSVCDVCREPCLISSQTLGLFTIYGNQRPPAKSILYRQGLSAWQTATGPEVPRLSQFMLPLVSQLFHFAPGTKEIPSNTY